MKRILRAAYCFAFIVVIAAALFADALVANNAAQGFAILFIMLFCAGLIVAACDMVDRR